jgi:hypothetical protein
MYGKAPGLGIDYQEPTDTFSQGNKGMGTNLSHKGGEFAYPGIRLEHKKS